MNQTRWKGNIALLLTGQGIQTPAVNALVPELVPQEQLTRVNGISGSIQSMVMFISPMAGGNGRYYSNFNSEDFEI